MNSLSCANWKQEGSNIACPEKGTKACSRCQLVAYCSRECQVAHWPFHKLDCNSNVRKPTWKPAWVVENRKPHFLTSDDSDPFVFYGGNKYLWGNVPALDLLRLRDNEGSNTNRDLSLLLAASGDLRNLVKTIVCVPEEYNRRILIDVNDRDEMVVSRSLLILLVAFHFPPEEANLIMLHLWYSAFLPEDLVESVQSKIAPLVQKVLKSKTAGLGGDLEGFWSRKFSNLSAELPRKTWSKLASYFSSKSNLPFDKASAQRQSVTLAHSRRDYRDRAMLRLPPSWRLAQLKFRKGGVLLPFGASFENFTVPNPTLFHPQLAWPMRDSSDPLDGWKFEEFLTEAHSAEHDIYGQLHFHVREMLFKFCQKIGTLQLHIRLFQMDAETLPTKILRLDKTQIYDRIELANIADRAYLGPLRTLALFSGFLKAREENPYSTLITLFLNATHEMTTPIDLKTCVVKSIRQVVQLMSIKPEAICNGDKANAEVVKAIHAQGLFADNDTLFNRFLEATQAEHIAKLFCGMAMKEKNTIVAKWPMRLGKKPTQKEFDLVCRSGHLGSERYVEWYRTS